MNYQQNHCFCLDSIWDGKTYNCRHIVFFNSYEEGNKEDWNNCIDPEADSMIEKGFGRERKINVINLKEDIINWLKLNVADRKVDGAIEKGWSIPSIESRARDQNTLNIFFHRKKDAMAFIREWSKWKKPIIYYHYFDNIRKELNLTTGKYENME
tara:strand:- start:40965 stop:41429 length:465 start_codon:yes stop_codon:yes gene_type:complete